MQEAIQLTAITATEARKYLFRLVSQVNEDHITVEIVSRNGNAVLLSKDDYDSLMETAYILSSPANARRLFRSLEATRGGEYIERELIE